MFVSLPEATNYDEVGTISLWVKTTKNDEDYLNGVIQLGGRDGTKLFLSLFSNDGKGKAVMKGSITTKVNDKYVKLAWVNLFKSTKDGALYYGYVNPVKDDEANNLNLTFSLYKNKSEPDSNQPVLKGKVQYFKREEGDKPQVKKNGHPTPQSIGADVTDVF